MRPILLILFTVAVACPAMVAAPVVPLVVGEGQNQSYLHIEFDDGAFYVFDVRYAAASVTTKQMVETIAAETSLTYTTQFSGYTLYGIAYDGHEYEDWFTGFWSLWYRDGDVGDWTYSSGGWAITPATDGQWHGLVADPGITRTASPSDAEIVSPGDANADGLVSDADYTIWADHYGQAGGFVSGDFNADGTISDADYTIWADHYGASVGMVPEPISIGMYIIYIPIFTSIRRRRRLPVAAGRGEWSRGLRRP